MGTVTAVADNPGASSRGIARSTVWHLAGQLVPIIVAFATVPILIRALGDARFGLLSIAWVVIGYFALVDLGLGRAVTQAIATRIGSESEPEIPAIFWWTFALMLGLGVVGAGLGAAVSPWLVGGVLSIPDGLQGEMRVAFLLLALGLPADMTLSALRGAMEACGRFDLTSMSRVATGLATYLAPMAVLPFTESLVAIVTVIVSGRLISWGIAFMLTMRLMPALRTRPDFRPEVVRPLLRTGGWMNVCGLIFPLMMTLDRFMIGSLVTVAAVTYYATPYEMVTRLWVIPAALSGVLFPAFSAAYRADRERAARLFDTGVRLVFLGMVPVTLMVVLFAEDGLRLWLGDGFAQQSRVVLQVLAVGVGVTSLSTIPFALVQGAGRPDLAAKLLIVELPIYVGAVWLAANRFGIEGVAAVWAIRGVLDTGALFVIARRLLGGRSWPVREALAVAAMGMILAGFAVSEAGLTVRIGFGVLALVGFGVVGWMLVLDPDDRQFVDRFRVKLPGRFGGAMPLRAHDVA